MMIPRSKDPRRWGEDPFMSSMTAVFNALSDPIRREITLIRNGLLGRRIVDALNTRAPQNLMAQTSDLFAPGHASPANDDREQEQQP